MLSITVDTRDLTRGLSNLTAKQIPFATASALTGMAFEARKEAQAALPRDFHIRTTWVAKGFRVDRATKGHLVARLWHKDPFMARQMYGGEKDGGVAVPAKDGFPSAPKRDTPTRPRDWPGALKHTFTVESKAGRLVFQRTGRRKKRRAAPGTREPGRDPNTRLMYVLKPEVKVPARWQLRERTTELVAKRFGIHFSQAFAHALRTAR